MTSKHALIVANTDYHDASFAKLIAPDNDAEEFAHVLSDTQLAAFDDVQVLLNEEEGHVRRAIARFFKNRNRDDLLLLYFSGHGVRNEEGHLFLAVHDTELGILEASGIRAEFVTHAMNNSRSQRQLLILDCCNSGAFAYGSKSSSGLGNSMGTAVAFEGNGFGRVILTASDATQYAWEGNKIIGDTQKSLFTHFLIEGLRGEADRNGDGRIDVDELYDYAYEQVVRVTPKQTPGKWSYKQQGDLILRDNLRMDEVMAVPLPSDLIDLLSHPNPSVRKVGMQDLLVLLDGTHLGLAHSALDKMREIASSDDSYNLRETANNWLIERKLELPVTGKPPVERKEPIPPLHLEDDRAVEQQMDAVVLPPIPKEEPLGQRVNYRRLGIVVMIVLGLIFAIRSGVYLRDLLASSPTEVPSPSVQSGMTSEIDSMTLVYVPAGEFTMGSSDGQPDEQPAHSVYLDAFWIDKIEVTNAMYSQCEKSGACSPPKQTRSNTRGSYFGNPQFDDFPVIYVSWSDAQNYCSWAGRRLPTEAEWEKAARGLEGRNYPWGNEPPNNTLLNYDHLGDTGDTTEVGKFPDGMSPYGALDMAGNVWEWVADWYEDSYYENSPASNPSGPESGQFRLLRGGPWSGDDDIVRSSYRYVVDPDTYERNVGFRCARDASP